MGKPKRTQTHKNYLVAGIEQVCNHRYSRFELAHPWALNLNEEASQLYTQSKFSSPSFRSVSYLFFICNILKNRGGENEAVCQD